ncbi:glyoxylase I 4 [Impatiens glandulifera]|uniref:glyoxylase I 4 n=1 Tax=Impatiens glandulifera TaxID=253017 RepID=UPI001FB0DEB5|nr:glyoxylase I 4 [Impatiens glandulifera]XP_047333737.1 glyoxylase I 4 [Impatiens glandulifera]
MAAAKTTYLNHISRESSDVKRLANFYQEIFGFERIENPKFEFEVIWLKLGDTMLHLIERDPVTKLPEGPWSSESSSVIKDPKHLPRGHHLCFSVPNFDSFVQTLKERGIEVNQRSLPDGSIKQAFFFDPDGNGLEAASMVQQ